MNLENVSIHNWIQKNGLRTEKGVKLDFNDHFFLYDPYRDFSPNLVVYKAAQIGFSVLAVNKVMFVAKNYGVDVIYTMPSDGDVRTFVSGKVNRIIKNNPILREWTKDKDSIEQKRVGDSVVYFRGTISKTAAISVTADLLVHDEEDFSDQEVIGDYDSRLQHSKLKWKWHFGHPSAPGVGVSKYWAKSDQKHWFIKCPHCKKKQYLEWPDSICFERREYICKYCKGVLDNRTRKMGFWVQKYKKTEYSGYWIPLMIAPWINAGYLIDKFNDDDVTEEFFTNRILGLPYVGGSNKVNEDDILGCCDTRTNPMVGKVVIGVDTGIRLRFVVGNEHGIFYWGQSKEISEYDPHKGESPYDEIEKLMRMYPDSIVVVDQGGDIIGSRQLQDKYIGRVFLCHYRQDRKSLTLVKWGSGDEEDGNVIVDRNRMIQFVIGEFKRRRIVLNGTREDFKGYWKHWDNIYRVSEEDNLGVIKYKWMRSGRDDWIHATIYWRVGMSKALSFGGGKVYGGDDDLIKVRTAPVANIDGTLVDPINCPIVEIDKVDWSLK